MKTFSNITWGLFVVTAIPVLFFWYRDYRNKGARFTKKGVLLRTVLIVFSSLFALLSLVSAKPSAGSDLLWILPDVLFVDVPYLYMVISRREKRDEHDQT